LELSSLSFSILRPHKIRSMPLAANASAVAAPIPEDAPVINAILFMFFVVLFLKQSYTERFSDLLCVFEFHGVFTSLFLLGF
jgi:hypothetical protein